MVTGFDGRRGHLSSQDDGSLSPHQRPGWREGEMDGTEQGVQGTDWKVPVLVADSVCVCVCVVCVCE